MSAAYSLPLKWSVKRRRAQGLGVYPNWALLGYKGRAWEIDEDEADVVRTIYSLYLEGYSSPQIADFLTKSGIPTVKGLSSWSSGSVLGILRNEKYCGDALCQKTVTISVRRLSVRLIRRNNEVFHRHTLDKTDRAGYNVCKLIR